jgi:hypothetical protein
MKNPSLIALSLISEGFFCQVPLGPLKNPVNHFLAYLPQLNSITI